MLTESQIITKHPHVIVGSVRFDAIRNKQVCTIFTRGINGEFDGNTREIATSDLHQTFWTVEVKKALDKIKAKAKRTAKREALLDAMPIVVLDDEDTSDDGLAALRSLVA